jgi:hypothetical protein
MSDWQPARFRIVHTDMPTEGRRRSAAEKMIIRVRPCGTRPRRAFCDAEKYYELHPDDVAKLYDGKSGWIVICEHEIFTD